MMTLEVSSLGRLKSSRIFKYLANFSDFFSVPNVKFDKIG